VKEFLGTNPELLKTGEFQTFENLWDFGVIKNPSITAFKGNLGHLNLASGAVESALCIMAMQASEAPGIANL
jgi:3-oxoacyl-(acyl-carrier-protein) synthase